MKSIVLIAFSFCCLLSGCAPNIETGGGRIDVTKDDEMRGVAQSVVKLAEISNSSGGRQGDQWQQDQIVEALKLGGSEVDYFSMDDLVNVLANYERRFGRDEFFYDAARLAYSYSDGEYAGRFEKHFPELVKVFQTL